MSIFSKIQMRKPKRSTFNLSHQRKFSCNMGELVPILCQETVPGDTWHINTNQILRMQPMLSPIMHDINTTVHFFFVPNRILWDNWEPFITGGEDGLSENLMPRIGLDRTFGIENPENVFDYRLSDYLGMPTLPFKGPDDPAQPTNNVSLLPYLAYQKIYNDYYRDENLINSIQDDLDAVVDGVNARNANWFLLRRRAWQHDYFTSALPFAQKGNPVRLPLGQSAPLKFKVPDAPNAVTYLDGSSASSQDVRTNSDGELADATGSQLFLDNSGNLEADLTEATSSTINDLRRAFKLQEWLERNARAGSRYVEMLLAHFGVRSSDARLQRPEFIGGGTSPIMISEVLQTSSTDGTSPQANMAGHGLNLGRNGHVKKYCEEHGFIIGIMSVMPKTTYQQGIPKQFTKFDKFDYFWQEFEHIGEQPILNKEIYASPQAGWDNEGTFGYTPRYAEYKYIPSSVHGDMKTSLDFWHLGRIFDPENPPTLSTDFIECKPSRRIFAVEDEEAEEGTLLVNLENAIRCSRLMSYYSDPSFR